MNTIIDWFKSWTMGGELAILLFPLFAGLLLFVSLKLVRYAEVIIAKTRFGGGFVGGTMIAAITSMPELITEVTQGVSGHPESGLGDDIGSNAFSIFLMGIGTIVFWRYMFMNNLGKWTKISLAMSFGLSIFLSIFLIVNRIYGYADIPAGYIGIIPLAFFLFYLVTLYLSYRFSDEDDEPADEDFVKKHTLKKSILAFVFFSLLLVLFAVLVNIDVRAFQEGLGIPEESVGGVFLAITTSLPEIVAFFAFMNRKQPSAAIASLVGSHFFNLGIMFFGDLAYEDGPTFNNPDMSKHLPLTILTVIMLLVVIAHFVGAKKWPKAFAKKWVYFTSSAAIMLTYIIGWIIILTLFR